MPWSQNGSKVGGELRFLLVKTMGPSMRVPRAIQLRGMRGLDTLNTEASVYGKSSGSLMREKSIYAPGAEGTRRSGWRPPGQASSYRCPPPGRQSSQISGCASPTGERPPPHPSRSSALSGRVGQRQDVPLDATPNARSLSRESIVTIEIYRLPPKVSAA
jgi:hypothetical protein